jgi:hypothetical protein
VGCTNVLGDDGDPRDGNGDGFDVTIDGDIEGQNVT